VNYIIKRAHRHNQGTLGAPKESKIDKAFAATRRVSELLVRPKCKFFRARGVTRSPDSLAGGNGARCPLPTPEAWRAEIQGRTPIASRRSTMNFGPSGLRCAPKTNWACFTVTWTAEDDGSVHQCNEQLQQSACVSPCYVILTVTSNISDDLMLRLERMITTCRADQNSCQVSDNDDDDDDMSK